MIPEERLTAYALNELEGPERAAMESHLATDAAAREFVETTRALAAQLTSTLAAEAKPATVATKPRRVWKPAYAALAASLLIAVGAAVYGTMLNSTNSRIHREMMPMAAKGQLEPDDEKKKDLTQSDLGLDDLRSAIHPEREVNAEEPVPRDPKPGQPPVMLSTTAAGAKPAPTPASPRPGLSSLTPQFRGINRVPASEQFNKRGTSIEDASLTLNAFGPADGAKPEHHPEPNSYNRFPPLEENAFVKVEGQAALSTFGVDVDTASYSIMRKYLSQNQLPPAGAVRLEEMVNYFPYRDLPPTGNDPFAVTVEVAECPWQPKHRLARIGLKAKPIDYKNRPASNLVFLIDVSGSMNGPTRLPLVKQSLKMLVNELGENDRVAMVVYAGASGLVLESTSASRKPEILDALDRLEAGGSTNGASGIQLAYDVAVKNFINEGTNRVILCTDGDWNVGTTSTDELIKLIEAKRKTNVFLSVFGFGMGNLRDEMMVQLAGKGNGNYGYIDSLREARKALVEQIGGTLVTVAKDVKIQVEFNPAKVGAYRLLGYEKRKLAAEDFHNDAKDAGEMGAGHVVTALYELAPAGSTVAAGVDGLRYQNATSAKSDSKEAFVVKLRHKLPTSDVSTLREVPVNDSSKAYAEASEDFRFAAAVASYAMLLRESPYKGNANYALVAELAGAAKSWDPGAYRAEFVRLAQKAKAVSGKP